MTKALAVPLVALAFHSAVQPLSAERRAELTGHFWHRGCPVGLSQLRVLTVNHWGFDGRIHTGQLIVNRGVAAPLRTVFRRLYALRFPIRNMNLEDVYAPHLSRPRVQDTTASFMCRDAVSSPCPGSPPTHHWSMHAYGLAIDLNPIENPYTGCGRTRIKESVPYLDRSKRRRGMVTPAVVEAFRSVGWGWGGDWTGTKDYMHFSANGH
jgi:D-alanyl-D-alanine carboxypeptidase